jgi:two-component system response regulator PilR (NtrC family)
MTLSTGREVRVGDIQLRPNPVTASSAGEHLLSAPDGNAPTALGDQLEDIEREAIVRALQQTRYNKTAAAKVLGMSFRALRYRIKKLGIE